MRTAVIIAQTLATRTRHAISLVPRLAKKPAVIPHWIISAHWAQLAAVLAAIAVPSFFRPAVDGMLERLYPPITYKKMLGLVEYTEPDPRLENRQELAQVLLWAGSAGIVLYLLLLHIPRGIDKATALARKHERKADTLAGSQPSESILLYNSALSLAADPKYQASLNDKLRALDKILSKIKEHEHAASIGGKSGEARVKTIVLETGLERGSHEKGTESMGTTQPEETQATGIRLAGRYSLKQELGRGAMGVVFRAHDHVLERDVALKQLPAYLSHDQELVERFRQEARALARLSHPHIVQVYDFVKEGKQSWIAMELVEGEELDKSLRDSGALQISETVRLGKHLAGALAYAHQRGVIHRDFKPENVLLSKQGLPKITDFGLAKLTQSSVHTQDGSFMGSPAYMSPEQVAGKGSDWRSDIYALGVTLYKMLTGRLPFEGDLESVIAQKLTKDPTPLPDLNDQIPTPLKRLVSQMLTKEPTKRPASMEVVVEALQAVSSILPT